MTGDMEGVFLNIEPQNKKCLMSRGNKYFDIGNLFRQSVYWRQSGCALVSPRVLFDIQNINTIDANDYRYTIPLIL